jgi:hypothetical protein
MNAPLPADQRCYCVGEIPAGVAKPCEKFERVTADWPGSDEWDDRDCVDCGHREECHVEK